MSSVEVITQAMFQSLIGIQQDFNTTSRHFCRLNTFQSLIGIQQDFNVGCQGNRLERLGFNP